MPPSKDEIFHALGLAVADGEASIRVVLRTLAEQHMPVADAIAFADTEYASILDEYGKHVQRAKAAGVRAYAAIPVSRPTHIVPVLEEGSLVFTARTRAWLLQKDWRDFETLVANALAGLPQTDAVFLGRGTQDFGMDFVVKWNPEVEAADPQGFRSPTMFDDMPTFLYGQCKKYAIGHNVGRPDIQKLQGSLTILQGHAGGVRAEALREKLLTWGWQPDAPHYLAFATTARFPLDWKKQDFPKLVKMDGEHVAQNLLRLNRNATWPQSVTHLDGLCAVGAKVTAEDLPPPPP